MHNAALAEVGLEGWRYQHLPVPPPLLAETLPALARAGFRGANVTVPHKAAALELADRRSERARAIGAANTLLFETDGTVAADNTDAEGFLACLPVPPRGRSAQILGAGGSARAVLWALVSAGAEPVSVWNRTPQRARELAAELGGRPVETPQPADILVNCTTIGLNAGDQLKQLPLATDGLASHVCVVDLVYGHTETPLTAAARRAGAVAVDGLEVLVAQGALSFELFTGRPAPVEIMRAAARRP